MNRVDICAIKGKTKEDDTSIMSTYAKQIEMTIDEFGRIFNEGGIYIADGEIVKPDEGIGCNTWGGYREGAGRKPTGRKRKYFYITDEEYEKMREFLESLRPGN